LLSVLWDADDALAVSHALKTGDHQVGGPQVLVWTLKKFNGQWKITDIDLDDVESLQVNNSRFLAKHPQARSWFDDPDLRAASRAENPDVGVEGESEGRKSE